MPATPAGYSGTPLPRKLGIRDGHRVALVSSPRAASDLLGELPPSVRVETDPSIPASADAPGGRSFDVIVQFVEDEAALARELPRAQRLLAWNGGLWIAWPKASSPLATGLREDHVRGAALAAGLVDNKVCAIDQDWSGLRLVYRRVDRPPAARRR